jgi:predicted Zn-dependent peptidase
MNGPDIHSCRKQWHLLRFNRLNERKHKLLKTASGTVILADRMEGVRSVTLGFFYRVGSRNEPLELNGITISSSMQSLKARNTARLLT